MKMKTFNKGTFDDLTKEIEKWINKNNIELMQLSHAVTDKGSWNEHTAIIIYEEKQEKEEIQKIKIQHGGKENA